MIDNRLEKKEKEKAPVLFSPGIIFKFVKKREILIKNRSQQKINSRIENYLI